MDNGFLIQRKSLIDRVNAWIASKDGNPVVVVSAENGSGKTCAIKEVIKSRNSAVYYEFAPGQLRKNQDAQNCLVSIYLGLTATLRLEEYETGNESRKSRPNPTTLDPSTLLLRCIALPLAKIKSSSSQNTLVEPIIVVVDGLDRCEASSRHTLLKLLLQSWPRLVIGSLVRLVVITSQKIDESEIEEGVDVITRLASKGSERDEVIHTYFEDILKQRGEDVEWETEKLDTLTRACNGSLLLAQYIVRRNLLSERNNLPRSFKEVMEQEYRPWFAPFLCSRDPVASVQEANVELLLDKSVSCKELDERFPMLTWMVTNSTCIDWFCNSNKERLRMDGHSKAARNLVQHIRTNDYALKHAVFHAMESGEAETARNVFVEFDLLYKLAQFDASQLLIDLDVYCSKRQQDMTVRVVRNCLMQAKRGLLHDPRQLPFQLLGRITGIATDARGDVEITNLLNACRQFRSKDFFWFRPIRASLPLVPETTMRVLRGHSDSVLCASTSSLDSLWPRMALTGSCDGTAKLWDIMSGRCELTLDCKGAGYVSGVALAVLSENELVAMTCTEDGIARMWHITRRDGVYSLSEQPISKNEKNVTVPHELDQEQQQNRKEPSVEDLVSPPPIALLIGHEKELTAGAFVPGSHTICATASLDKTVRLWELPQPSNAGKEDPKCLHVLKGHESAVLCVAFIPESFELIATGSKDRTIRIWSCKRGTCLSTFGGHISNITSIAFRSDGNVFATGGWDSIVKIWTVAEAMNAQLVDPGMNEDEQEAMNNRVKEKCMLIHKDWVWSVTFVEGNRDLVVTGTDNGVVRIWSISTSQCVLAFDAHFGVGIYCMSAIGSEYLVTAGMDATLRIFDISPARLNTQLNLLGFESWTSLDAPHRFQGEVLSAAFPAQTLSKRLGIFSAMDKSIRAFDLNTGRCIKRLDSTKSHSAPVIRLLVSEDEKHLRSIDGTGKVANWNRLTLEPSEDVIFLASCFPCLSPFGRFYNTGFTVSTVDGPGHFLPPDSIYDDLSISEDTGERLSFIPVTFDTMLPLNCWLSPPPPNQADDGPFIEGVIVVTEKNGLVHVLHPMI